MRLRQIIWQDHWVFQVSAKSPPYTLFKTYGKLLSSPYVARGIQMTTDPVVRYQFLEEQTIHEFIFVEATRKAMDQYIGTIYEIYDEHLKGKPSMRILLDIHQSGMLPVKYASAIMEKTFKELAPFPKPYVAYLSEGNLNDSLISTMNYTASKHVDRLTFQIQDRDKAIEWLVSKGNN